MLLVHAVFVALLTGSAALFTVLSILNVRHGAEMVEREANWIEETLSIDDPGRLIDYTRARAGLSELRSWTGLGGLFLVLYSGVFADAVAAVEATGWPFIARGVAFFLGLVLVASLASAPYDLFSAFVIEELFDFNEQTPRLWLRDQLVGLAITTVITVVLGGGVLLLLQEFPGWWWVGAWALFVGFQLLMYVLYPRVIAPLFYDFQPVEEGDLREAVEDVFERAGFSMSGIYVIDASRRTAKSNAFFAGFGRTKRVALFDTLVEQLDREEIGSVLAHELAHWKKAHVWKRLAAGAARTGVVLFALSLLLRTDWLYGMFGVGTDATYAGLVLAGLWISPVSQLLAPLDNRLSISHEYEADAFAVEVMDDSETVRDALRTIAGENLSNPFPHPAYEAFHYDHPPLAERLRAIRAKAGDSVSGSEESETPGAT